MTEEGRPTEREVALDEDRSVSVATWMRGAQKMIEDGWPLDGVLRVLIRLAFNDGATAVLSQIERERPKSDGEARKRLLEALDKAEVDDS